MGSDNAAPFRRHHRRPFRHDLLMCFVCVVLGLVLGRFGSDHGMTFWSSQNSVLQAAGDKTSGACDIVLSPYHGTEYRSNMTAGSPHCLVESKFLKVSQHTVRMNDKILHDWLWIDYHDRINVLVEAPRTMWKNNDEAHFMVFRQTKYALQDRPSLAIVGGIIEPHEAAIDAARREVTEEMQVRCQVWDALGVYRTDVNRGMGWTNAFVARQCRHISDTTPDANNNNNNAEEAVGVADTERQDLQVLSRSKVLAELRAGNFLEIQWSATVALAMLRYDNDKNTAKV